LFSGKSIKTAATRAALFDSSMHQIAPQTPLGELTALPQVSYLGLMGPISKGTPGEGELLEGHRCKKNVKNMINVK